MWAVVNTVMNFRLSLKAANLLTSFPRIFCTMEFVKFYVHGTVHRNSMSINVQQDATIHSLFYL